MKKIPYIFYPYNDEVLTGLDLIKKENTKVR